MVLDIVGISSQKRRERDVDLQYEKFRKEVDYR
jgi:hypothetical protein